MGGWRRVLGAGLVFTWNAVPAAAATPEVVDGKPTAAACAALGFGPARREEFRTPFQVPSRRQAGPVGEVTVTAQRRGVPQIPPLAVPPVQHRTQEPSFAAPNVPTIPPLPVPPVARPLGATPNAPFLNRETERYPAAASNPIRQVAEAPVSTFSVDVDTASYANVRRFLHEGHRPPTDAVRVEELVNYFDYAYPRPTDPKQPFRAFVAVAPSPWSAEREILHIGLQAYEVPAARKPPLNLVFLIDTSGSMMSEDRLPLARQALNVLIDQLRPQDRVAMVAYAGSAGAVLGPTAGAEKLRMRCALESLQAGGSTAGGQGLALAYRLAEQHFDPKAINRVVLMTDGDFNVGVADPAKLKDFVADKRKTGVYLSVYGFGRGNYNDVMMQALAQNGNGTAGYVDGLREARKLFRDDFSRSFTPVADDVKVQVEFNPAAVREYRLIGYETRMLAREDFNNDRVDAGEVGSGASVTALYEITPAGAHPSADPLRYAAPTPPPGPAQELAFLKIRYKLPGRKSSRLISRPITRADVAPTLAAAPPATRWGVAVAGFGQKLRDEPWLHASYGWPQIAALAERSRGADPYGLRAEFVELAQDAGALRTLSEAAGGE